MKEKSKNVIKALSNNQRIKMIMCLSKPQCVNSLLKHCKLSQSAISQHLKILKDNGLVKCDRDGKNQIYCVSDKKILEVARLLSKIN